MYNSGSNSSYRAHWDKIHHSVMYGKLYSIVHSMNGQGPYFNSVIVAMQPILQKLTTNLQMVVSTIVIFIQFILVQTISSNVPRTSYMGTKILHDNPIYTQGSSHRDVAQNCTDKTTLILLIPPPQVELPSWYKQSTNWFLFHMLFFSD